MSESFIFIDDIGIKRWKNEAGQLHREDGPAVVYPDGTKAWYQNGNLHRSDRPAIEYPNGTKMWYQNGLRHRIDGPAVIYPNGNKEWWFNFYFLGEGLDGFWVLWNHLDEDQRQNVNLHMWLRKLTD